MKILVVEDEKVISDLIVLAIEQIGHHPVTSYDGQQAIDVIINETIDLILLDIVLPTVSGIEVLEFMDVENIEIPTVILSSLDSEKDQLTGFEFAIEDYWLKPIPYKVLMNKLQRLISRISSKEDGVVVDDKINDVIIDNNPCHLTYLEYRLFRFLYSNSGRYCTKDEIITRTWGEDVFVEDRNVDFTVRRIRKKLGKNAKLIKTKVKVGYCYENSN